MIITERKVLEMLPVLVHCWSYIIIEISGDPIISLAGLNIIARNVKVIIIITDCSLRLLYYYFITYVVISVVWD